MSDETGREPTEGAPMDDRGPAGERPENADQRPAEGQPQGGPPRWDGGRRRRGRRGRGGRGPGAPYPPRVAEEDEGSAQAREVGAYERRQQQQQRGPWRGPGFRAPAAGGRPAFGARPAAGGRPAYGQRPGAFRGQRPGAGRYQEMIRRATAGPRTGPPEEAGEPIAGPHAVLEALRAGRALKRIYVSQDRGVRTGAVNDLIREAQERHVMVIFVDPLEVQRLSPGVEHQGVVGIAEGRPGVELDELLVHLDALTEPPLILVIDSLQDPQNFGVLLRSAEGAGVEGVIIPRHRQVGLTPAVARTSAGASEHLLIADVANLRQALDALRERGVWVVGTDESGDLEWDAVDYRGATAIVVGGEGEGIRRLVLEGCDQVVRIPMQGQVSSLNAAAAGTVVLFEALRQRMRDAAPPQVEPRPRAQPVHPENGEERPDAEGAATDSEEIANENKGLLLDKEAPAGDAIRGDDQDVEEFAEAAADVDEAEPAPKRPSAKPTKRATRKRPAE